MKDKNKSKAELIEELNLLRSELNSMKDSENFFRSIIQNSRDAILLTAPDGGIFAANPAACKMFGKTEEEIRSAGGNALMDLNDPQFAELLIELKKKRKSTNEMNMLRPNGTVLKVELSTYIFNRIPYTSILIRDITRRNKVEHSFKRSEKSYKELADSITDIFFAFDSNLRYTYWNKASEILTGITAQQAIGNSLLDVFPDTPEVRKAERVYLEVLKTKQHKSFLNENKIGDKNYVFEIEAYPTEEGLSVFVKDITKRKIMEDALRESEEKYSVLFDNVPLAAALSSIQDGRIMEINATFEKYFGFSREEIVGRTTLELGINPNKALREKILSELQKHDFVKEIEMTLYTKKGEKKIFLVNMHKVKIRSEKYILQTAHDLTERKRAEEAKIESEDRLKLIMDGSQIGYWDWDIETGKVTRNNYWAEMLGYTLPEIEFTVKQWSDLHHPDDREAAWKSIKENLEGKKAFHRMEYRMRTKDGGYKWILDQARIVKRDDNGKALRMCGTHTDITGLKNTEEMLKKSEASYRLLVDNQTDLLVKVDLEGRFLFVSPSYCRTFGKEENELLGKSFMPLVHEDYREFTEKEMNNIYKPPYTAYMEQQAMTIDGWKWLAWVDTGILNEHGEIQEIIGVGRDITKQKEAEENLLSSRQELRLLSAHLEDIREEERANISREIHDELGQILTSLNIDLRLLKTQFGDKAIQNKFNNMIKLVVNTIRTVQRISTDLYPSILIDLGLASAIEWQVNEFAKRTGIKCKTKLAEIETDDTRKVLSLYRILQEGLTNIMKHAYAKNVDVKLEKKGQYIILVITDDGTGFIKKDIGGRPKMGISGIRERLKQFEGELNIYTKKNKGSKLEIIVPFK